MLSEIFLFMSMFFFALTQSFFCFYQQENTNSYKVILSSLIVNQHRSLISFCSSRAEGCNEKDFINGFIPQEQFMSKIFYNSPLSKKNISVSCYNNGYLYTFFNPNNSFILSKSNVNIHQIFSVIDSESSGGVYPIDRNSAFYDEIPSEICSYSGTDFNKKDIPFFLVNYIG